MAGMYTNTYTRICVYIYIYTGIYLCIYVYTPFSLYLHVELHMYVWIQEPTLDGGAPSCVLMRHAHPISGQAFSGHLSLDDAARFMSPPTASNSSSRRRRRSSSSSSSSSKSKSKCKSKSNSNSNRKSIV